MKAFLKWSLRLLLLVVLVVGCGLAYLDLHGFPPVLVRWITQQFARAGYHVQVSAIHFDWRRGVVASDMVLADAKTPAEPLGRVDEVQLQLDWRRLFQGRNAIRGLRIANANLLLPIVADDKSATQFTAEGAHARLRFEEDGTIHIEQLVGVYCGIHLRVHGAIKPSQATISAEDQRERLRGRFAFVTKALAELNSLEAAEPPQLDVDFDIDLARPWAGRVGAKLAGRQVRYRRLQVDSIWVDVRMQEAAIKIAACELVAGGGAISIGGDYDVGQGRFDLQLSSTIHPSILAPMLPEKAAQVLREVRVGQRPKIAARYVLSPETGTEPKLSGTVQLGDLELRGVHFAGVRAQLEKLGNDLFVREAVVEMQDGRLTGKGQINLKTTSFDYAFDSTLNPGHLLVFMPPGVRNFMAPSWFEQSPQIRAQVAGDFVDPEKFAYDAEVSSRSGSYRGVAFRSGSARLRLRRNQLSIQDLAVRRPDGVVRGQVQVDFPREQVAFDLQSTANPVALAPVLGPKAASFAEHYELGPGTRGWARGLADFRQPTATVWRAEITNQLVRAWNVTASQAHALLAFTNDQLHVVARGARVEYGKVRAEQAWADFLITTNQAQGVADVLGLTAWGLTAAQATGSFAWAENQLRLDTTAQQVKGWSVQADTAAAQITASSNSIHAAIDTTGFGWWRLKTATARGQLLITNDLLRVSDFAGAFYGGQIRGQAQFDGNTNSLAYQIALEVERSNLEQLIVDLREAPGRRQTGTLNGSLRLEGQGTGTTNLTGRGKLSVTDGVLWRGALFGPISQLLGETKATDAKLTYTIANRVFKTDDIEVAAGAFTARSHGTVDFDGKLDFRVQAQFLRSWPGINLFGVLLGKVLEYKVGGSLSNPNYRAVNLPKELLPHD